MEIEFISNRFKNFFSYGNNITEVFYQKGLNLITAKNGQGKSSLIIEPLTFCLYGKPYRKIKIDQLINDKNGSKLWTETIFIKGEDKYKIERGLKPAILKIYKTHKTKEFTSDDELDLKSHKALIQDEIDKILGVNFALFRQIISLSILNNKPFLTLEAQEKRDILESIFNIKIFGKMLKTLKKNFSVLQSTLELKGRELDLVKESLRGLDEQIKSLKKAKDDFQKEKEISILNLDTKIQKLKIELMEVDAKIVALDPKKLNEYDDSAKQKIKIENQDILNEWMEARTLKNRISDQMKNIAPISDKESLEKISGLEKEKDEFNRNLITIQNKKKGLTSEQVERESDFCRKTNRNVIESLAELKRVRSDIEKVKAGEGECEYCKQPISEDHKKEELDKLQLREKEIESNVLAMQKQIKEEVQKIIVKENEALDSKEETLRSFIETIDLDMKSIERLKIKTKEEHEAKEKKRLAKELEEIEKKISELDDKRQTKVKELEELEKVEKEIVELKNQSKMLLIRRENIETNLNGLQNDLAKEQEKKFSIDIEPLVKDFETKKANGSILNRTVKEMKRQVNVSEVIKGILDEDGIKKYFFSRLIPKLNESINQFLDYFELPLNFSFDDTFEPTIKELNRERSYYNFSGGERFRIDLSIVLSFMELNRMINSFHCNVLFFDELLDTGVDDDGMELVLEKLHDLIHENGNACYIISQRQLESSVHIDNIIKVKKVNGFSKLV